jgi:nitroreductase
VNETLRTIHSLRTIHGDFSNREVSEADLELVLEASVRAANASARQSYSIVVVSDPERMQALSGYRASRMLVYCVDFNRIVDTAGRLGCTFDASTLVNFTTGTIDTVLAAQTAAIAARSLGIDSFFTNGIHRGDIQRVYDLLELPESCCFPVIALLLGYAASEPEHLKGRLSGAGVVHRDRYQRLTGEEADRLIAEYDDAERHLGLVSDWAEQGFEHYLEWFYTKWSAGSPGPPPQFFGLLARAGFITEAEVRSS